MRHTWARAVAILLLACGAAPAGAQEPICITGVAGGANSWIDNVNDAPGGVASSASGATRLGGSLVRTVDAAAN